MTQRGIVVTALEGRTVGSAESSFAVAEWSDEGGSSDPPRLIAPLHLHHAEEEFWYVLAGTLRFRLADEEVEATSGSLVFVPRGVPHAFWNPAPVAARYLLVMGPKTLQLVEALHSLPDRRPETLQPVFRKYDSELLEEPL